MTTELRVHLQNYIDNWPLEAEEEFDHEIAEGSTLQYKTVNTFKIKVDTVTSEQVKTQIALTLFDNLVHDTKHNYANGKRCCYCFNSTGVSLSEDEAFMQCSTCERVYPYHKTYSKVPIPMPDYFTLVTMEDFPLTISTLREDVTKTIVEFSKDVKHQNELYIPAEINTRDVYVLYLPDIDIILKTAKVNALYQKTFLSYFWKNGENYITKSDFTEDSNAMKQLFSSTQNTQTMLAEFNNIPEIEIDHLARMYSKIIVSKYIPTDTTPPLKIDLLTHFHTIPVNSTVPYISLYIPEINKIKKRVLRALPFELLETWEDTSSRSKHLILKVQILNSYFTLIITNDGTVKIILPFGPHAPEIKTHIISDIVIEANKVLGEIDPILVFNTVVSTWGTIDSPVEFGTLNVNYTFKVPGEDISTIQLSSIVNCLSTHALLNYADETVLSMLYTLDNQREDSVRMRYDRFLQKLVRKKFSHIYGPNTPVDVLEYTKIIEEIKIQFGDTFDLSGNQLDVLYDTWVYKNTDLLKQLKDKNVVPIFKSMDDGVVIRVENTGNGVFRIVAQGLKTWNQRKTILVFMRKLFNLLRTYNTNAFFKKHCTLKKVSASIQKKNAKLRVALKQYLPELYWSAQGTDKGFVRKCQKKDQPLLFTDKGSYQEWMDTQTLKNPTNLQKIFTLGMPDVPLSKLNNLLEENNLPSSTAEQKKLRSIELQMHLLDTLKYPEEELKEIAASLMYPQLEHTSHLEEGLQQHLKIQEFLVRENIENIVPNPHSFIVKKNDQEFYLTCPNGNAGTDNNYVGFLGLDEHPKGKTAVGDDKRKFCVPCCRKMVDNARTAFCSGSIPYTEYLEYKASNTKKEYIKNQKKFPLEELRLGYVPKPLEEIFIDREVLRVGTKNTTFTFIEAVCTALKLHTKRFDHLLKKIQNSITPEIFTSLNSGNLSWVFNNSLTQYKSLFNLDNEVPIDYQMIWELLSLPGILTENGINIMIFEVNDLNVNILCPQDQELDYFLDPKKDTVLLYTQNNKFEPIVTSINKFKWIGTYDVNKDAFDGIIRWYKDACKILDIHHTISAKSLLKKHQGVFKYQVISPFNKIMYLVTNDNKLIPTIPSGMKTNFPVISVNEALEKYTSDYKMTIKLLKDYSIPIKGIFNNHTIVCLDGITIPFNNPGNIVITDYPIITINYAEIDNEILLSDTPPTALFDSVSEEEYIQENYTLFHYYYTNTQDTHKKYKSIGEYIHDFIMIVPDFIVRGDYQVQNIRRIDPNNTVHYTEDGHKLKVRKSDIESFKSRLANELEYPMKISIPTIINPLSFIDDINTYYV
jgi:hypothetical protein